ncbi:MAG: type III pantothenate kinase, partial [Richelia sp. RM2_1_2]|nr:type III pantothenate kinase [Richelia sp. RM2_1_2]
TISAIQSGILLGYVGLVKHLIAEIKKEIASNQIKVIATGGLSSILTPLRIEFDEIDPMLTLNGLKIIGEIVTKSNA